MLYILLGYMFLFIHRPFEIWPWLGEYRVERVYILAAAAVWLIYPAKRIVPTRYDLAIFLFCCAVLFSWMLSPWSAGCEATIEDYLKIVFFYVLVSTAVTRTDQLKKLSLGFLIIMAVYLLHSLWEYRNGRHTYRMGIPRMIGVDTTLGDPNSFGASIVYALPFVRLFWLTSRQRWIKLFLAGYTGLSVLCILLTGSRSSLLGLLLWGMITVLQSQRRLRYLALGGVVAMAAFAALPGELQTRFETMINSEVGPENARISGYGRLEGLINGFGLLEKYPLSGCGPGVWRKATGSTIESHNLYGQVMGELGGVGVLAFSSLVLVFAFGIWKLRKRVQSLPTPDGQFLFHLTTTLATALALLLLEGLFGHSLFRFTWLWYIGFLVIANRSLRRTESQAWIPMGAPLARFAS